MCTVTPGEYAESAIDSAGDDLGHDTLEAVHQRFAELAQENGETLTRLNLVAFTKWAVHIKHKL